ncbi:hypothetical protein L226DRAFT_611006 [Lentinus tigrinus ALCF2SS1-7]|uniref:SP-RING-type domain-containing protein n=1 Tax=Lentinus tigrinus ALCF2SS1-6 TaxID=1328759 RepID=A0A5C2SGN5_9APHY|nr:hypothetical protein L227DRAFT_544987 [Lentinus tigrinus ALCF2SS1-6]RPD77797.1 hypothetical protein L226DRAFT_611006 [Lentinus tigrinus ALCF2SS1-7]
MPVASSSRTGKRHRRAPSSDIEEDGPSQARPRREEEDVEMDEEEQQPRRSKKDKKKKKAHQDDSDAEDNVDDEDIPVPDIKDQPLDRVLGQKVHGLSGDWGVLREKAHAQSYTFIREVGAAVAEFTEGEKGEKALATVDSLMRDLLDTEQELSSHEQALDDLYNRISKGEEIVGITDAYEKLVKDKMNAYNARTSRQKYAKSDHYQQFKQAIYEVHHPDTAMPPVVDLIPREDGDVSDDDDDEVQIGGVTQDYKCPLTLTILVDPLTSKECGHSYSAAAIRAYLGPSRTRYKDCPATGCRKQICLNDLEEDKVLARRAKEAARRERAREEDSDDDGEVIE